MVLSILSVPIRGLIRLRSRLRTRLASSRRSRRNSSATAASATLPATHSTITTSSGAMDDERGAMLVGGVVSAVVAAGDRERGERTGGGDRGFMTSARMATSATMAPPVVSTTTITPVSAITTTTASSKRKLDELEIGVTDQFAFPNSQQVRARLEARGDEVLEGGSSIAESSGRERIIFAVSGGKAAQALDGETQMREEGGGNEAVDADADDAMWEEEAGWNKTGEPKLLGAPDVVEIGAVSADSTPTSNLMDVDSPVDSAGGHVGAFISSVSVEPGVLFSDEESAAGKDGTESSKDSTTNELVDGLRSRERDSSLFGLEEELGSSRPRLYSLTAGLEAGAGNVGEGYSSSCSSTNGVVVSVGNVDDGSSCSSSGSGSLARAMVIDTVAANNRGRIQFFVRTYIDGRATVVLHANACDSVESVHEQILLKTGIPVSEQRLIFGGRQLQHDQTLESCHVVNDATLNLVARMKSTALPHTWIVVNDLVATIRLICESGVDHIKLMHSQDFVRQHVQEFLKMASKSVPVSEHMQVFQQAGATSTLVMLLLSQVESNRDCAEEAITNFLHANDEYLPAHIHCHCAPLLLDFCKLLGKSAPSHSLYSSCRNALARLLDTVGVAHGSPYFYEAKADSIVHDLSPFVNELSLSLSSNLRFIAEVYTRKDVSIDFTFYVKEAKDFAAFVIPLCKAMEACKGVDASSNNGGRGGDDCLPGLRFPRNGGGIGIADDALGLRLSNDCHWAAGNGDGETMTGRSTLGVGLEIGSQVWLRTLFLELLEEIDNCLKAVSHVAEKATEPKAGTGGSSAVPAVDRERPLGWAPFLVVLKGLHAIAKLYDSAMNELLIVLANRYKALQVLIRQSRWQDDDFWLLEHKSLLNFESKRRLVLAMLPEPQDDHNERQEIVVHRSQLLTESFELLAYVEPDGLQGGISVEFATEEATGPGVLREWFSMICREIFNCQNALFLPCPKDRRRFFPNPASGVNPGHLTYFRFCGRVIALALMHRVQVDVVFAVTFFKQLAGRPISWEDAKDADPVLYESCKKILEMDAETIDSDALGLTFVSEVEELGSHKTLELCQGGKEMVVNSENRKQFVELLVHRRLVASVADQIKSFSQGFSDLLVNASHQQFLRALEPEDFDLMLFGNDRNICFEDWRMHTEYHDYVPIDPEIVWFWQVVATMTPEERRRLLFFSTSVTHLPAEGFAGLSSKFHIHRAHTDTSWLPTAHTCFYQLVLPAYPTYDIMYARLHAITEVHIAEGFGFA